MWNDKKVLIGLTGSISAYKVCELISLLKKRGAQVRVMATESALEFVGRASLEGLSGEAVLTSDFTPGSMMDHIHWSKWADAFVIAPATAQTLNSLASGTGHGIVMSCYLAYELQRKPLIVAPAMNTQMLLHPTTQKSLRTLKEMGVKVLDTGSGELACGDVGLGRLLEPAQILTEIERSLTPKNKGPRVLITAGGTKVPLDGVRSLSNTSTGKTGSLLADHLTRQNFQVDLLLSKNGVRPESTKNVELFETYEDLHQLMQTKLQDQSYDYVVHAAAVSDYTVDRIESEQGQNLHGQKLASGQNLHVILKPTEKILSKIKGWSPQSRVIAFKLTSDADAPTRQKAVDKLFENSADWVIHNDTREMSEDQHLFTVFNSHGKTASAQNAGELAQHLETLIRPKEIL